MTGSGALGEAIVQVYYLLLPHTVSSGSSPGLVAASRVLGVSP